MHEGGEVFPGLVVPGDPRTALPPAPGSLLSGRPSAAGVDAAMAITVRWEGGARGLFGTLIPGSTGAVGCCFSLGCSSLESGFLLYGARGGRRAGGGASQSRRERAAIKRLPRAGLGMMGGKYVNSQEGEKNSRAQPQPM